MALHFVSLSVIRFVVGRMATISNFFIPVGIVDTSLVSIGVVNVSKASRNIMYDVFPLV